MTDGVARVQIKRVASCTLGKMVQSSPREGDLQAPYLRAAHIQPGGSLIELPDQRMWFSRSELKALDLREDDVVVVEGGAGFGRSAVLPKGLDGWGFQNSIIRVRPRPGAADGRFLDYAIQAALLGGEIESLVSTATIQHFTAEKVSRLRIADHNRMAQIAIADYLDRETAQIDAFIAKNEDLMALLAERRAVVGQQEVERRVGNGARIKFRFREMEERAGERVGGLPLLSVSIHKGVFAPDAESNGADSGLDLSHYRVARQGDIVVNRMRAFQGALGVAPRDGLVSPDYAVLRLDAGVDPEWFAVVMRTSRFVGEMVRRLRGIGTTDSGAVRTPRIGVSDLGEIRVDVPPLSEQRYELAAVAGSILRIDQVVERVSRAIDLARERRAALISAAVTGKIDVGVAA